MKGFRDFLLRGNVVDLAVGIVIGVAFQSLVTAFVKAFLTPLVGLAVGASGDFSTKGFSIGKLEFPYGAFLTALLSFVLIAAVVYFFVVSPMNRLMAAVAPQHDEGSPRRDCPQCLSSVPTAARRCSYCTSELVPVVPDTEPRP